MHLTSCRVTDGRNGMCEKDDLRRRLGENLKEQADYGLIDRSRSVEAQWREF